MPKSARKAASKSPPKSAPKSPPKSQPRTKTRGNKKPYPTKQTASRPSRRQAEAAITTLLSYIGEDPSREGLADTPARVVRAFEERTQGYEQDPLSLLRRTFLKPQAMTKLFSSPMWISSRSANTTFYPLSEKSISATCQAIACRNLKTRPCRRNLRPPLASPREIHRPSRRHHQRSPKAPRSRSHRRSHTPLHVRTRRCQKRCRHDHFFYAGFFPHQVQHASRIPRPSRKSRPTQTALGRVKRHGSTVGGDFEL